MGRALQWLCCIFSKSNKDGKSKRIPSSTKLRKHNQDYDKIAAVDEKRNGRGDQSARRSSFEGYAIVDYSHAEAVAAASATAAEAAVVAAQAAVEVVRLTRSGRLEFDLSSRAAVVIQSAFRGYLARKALRALRSLVKLQALVRGYIIRKQAADHMRRMHALLKAQAYARAIRAPAPASSSHSSAHSYTTHSSMLSRIKQTSESSEFTSQARISGYDQLVESYHDPYSPEGLNLHLPKEIIHTADNSHWFDSGSSRSCSTRRRDVDYPESDLNSAHLELPNYMAYTKSSEAKLRSVSAPKQRTLKSNCTRDLGRRLSPSRAS